MCESTCGKRACVCVVMCGRKVCAHVCAFVMCICKKGAVVCNVCIEIVCVCVLL